MKKPQPEQYSPAMDAGQFKKAAADVIDNVISYFSTVSDRKVLPSIQPGYLAPQLPQEAPQSPESFDDIIPDINDKIIPGLTHWQSPNFMAFFPAMVTYPAILGEIYSAAFNAPAFNWLCSPACTELETIVMDWLAKMQGLDEGWLSSSQGGGVLQGSASEAIVTVMVAARHKAIAAQLEREGLLPILPDEAADLVERREDRAAEIRSKLVALGSEQSHSSTQKAANILGIRYRNVKADESTGYRMTGAALDSRLKEIEDAGLTPFFVTATLGTTGTCAVDDFEGIASVRQQRPDLWVHVDAAYAGTALICPEYREPAGAKWLKCFDSYDFNMHKWMLVNFDASCLFVRNRTHLTSALSITPSYLVNPPAISGLVTDYRDWQIPLGRRFRALKIWFVLRCYGVAKIQELVRRHVALGEQFGEWVKQRKDLLEIVAGPAFALTVVRCVPRHLEVTNGASNGANGHHQHANGTDTNGTDANATDVNGQLLDNPQDEMNGLGTTPIKPAAKNKAYEEAANALTKSVYELINSRGDVFLTSSVIDGRYCIRIVSANERTDEKHLRRAFDIIVDATTEILAS